MEPTVYLLCWEKRTGHYLVKQPEVQSVEKIFGPMAGKEKKVLKTFERRKGNTGIILSGEKGLGKSLFCRHLMLQCLESYIPVIIVRDLIPGTANFIQSIGQPCMFVFDEFEKIFTKNDDDSDQPDNQVQFLSLLDGTGGAKRLFVITCNELWKINEYFVDRPGRFFYHFRFTPPDGPLVVKYLKALGAKLKKEEIDKLNNIASFMSLNFDVLHAIAEEIKAGYSLDETLNDLNISNGSERSKTMQVTVITEDNKTLTNFEEDYFDPTREGVYVHLYNPASNPDWDASLCGGNIMTKRLKFKETNEKGEAIYTLSNLEDAHDIKWFNNAGKKLANKKVKIKEISIKIMPRQERTQLFRARQIYDYV